VCGKSFEYDDDVVTCPVCGTPHHRECYNSLGHCVNADKHSTGFEYSANADNSSAKSEQANTAQQENTTQYSNYYQPNEQANANKTCSNCGNEINSNAPFCSYCGAKQDGTQFNGYNPTDNFGFGYEQQKTYDNNATIDGKNVSDVAAVVRTNVEKFIPKFIKNKNVSWNWSAFIFGPYYLFYRKMYKQGSLFLAIELIISLVCNGLFPEEISAFYSFYNTNYTAIFSNPTTELINQFTELYRALVPMMLLIIGGYLIVHIVIALFADKFYRGKTLQVVDKVNSSLANGGNFDIPNQMFNGPSLSQDDMKRLYLGKLGGTSFIAPILAYFILDIVKSIITTII
jgi:endogenous inhibitor of DNA gyrase (YacG/DUF329 family)